LSREPNYFPQKPAEFRSKQLAGPSCPVDPPCPYTGRESQERPVQGEDRRER